MVRTEARKETAKIKVSSTPVRPAAGTLEAPLESLAPSSPFGLRTSPITGSAGEFHWGLDFSAACGTGVYAADAGVVRAVGWHPWGGGNRVEIDHGNGLITTYNHLAGIAVRRGQTVQASELIAQVGTTGASTGCHLHFETILNGTYTDPAKWMLQPLHPASISSDTKMTDYQKENPAANSVSWTVPSASPLNSNAAAADAQSKATGAAKEQGKANK
ncbi:M23 family metallopeptidase [Arthrobacter sp. MAHUQ-56]|nr:M23 family metallopeptidase [Arthrobacter sp. MAHUQ-56]